MSLLWTNHPKWTEIGTTWINNFIQQRFVELTEFVRSIFVQAQKIVYLHFKTKLITQLDIRTHFDWPIERTHILLSIVYFFFTFQIEYIDSACLHDTCCSAVSIHLQIVINVCLRIFIIQNYYLSAIDFFWNNNMFVESEEHYL